MHPENLSQKNTIYQQVNNTEALFCEYGGFIRSVIDFALNSPSDTEDLYQDLFLMLSAKPIPDEILSEHGRTGLHVFLFSFDDDFANYFNSKSKNASIENALTQGGAPIHTNISGSNVLGAFTASSRALLTLGVQN